MGDDIVELATKIEALKNKLVLAMKNGYKKLKNMELMKL